MYNPNSLSLTPKPKRIIIPFCSVYLTNIINQVEYLTIYKILNPKESKTPKKRKF
ncbi:hypothetical protein AAE02nite_36050 [Adhaeribacter aerolatus]|uniref:Uncharacterized protein n=1 Tax=Adhaeribacter aerolatus TaxID=670289 RepID=A0A512B1W1_9BACT|nr:hypothetical protein AAE02nite_36050 [Adhaeribacter aerolatus]